MARLQRHGRAQVDGPILAAPDVDVDVFQNDGLDMATRVRNPRVASREDKGLAESRSVWSSDTRLGAIDPSFDPDPHNIEAVCHRPE
jgi:esterase/lipase superfamily enzyme